ncbi:hypothetical protein NXW11_24670 [Bacteroides thetaiotaomicron]|uniref:hypothetical protein n=1 Tax=Bacteroides thetaiotaomicron TaxID=818 RepID=UPI0021658FF8|nr:hypothetical protein [Bacteroides thetaiotaomicron]MCS2621080.1 hypothetical protein [Bacteroides thetaiotaomicron]
MRKEYYNYVVKLPVLLHELFRGKGCRLSFFRHDGSDEPPGEVLHPHRRMGGRVSTATRRILLCMDRIPDMSFFFRRQEKSVLFFEMDPAVAGSLQRAIIAGAGQPPASCRPPGVRLLLRCGVTLNNLSMELASEEVFRRPEGYLIHTYVSNYQYVFLKETAAAQRMSVEGMLTAAAELLVGTMTKVPDTIFRRSRPYR